MTKTSKAAGRREPEGMIRKAKFPRSYIKEALGIDVGDINRYLLFALITTFKVGNLCYPGNVARVL
jgi:hypothetical protein